MYRLQLTDFAFNPAYGTEVQRLIVKSDPHIPSLVSSTPASNSLGVWRYYPAFEGGASSTVYRGYHSENAEVVVLKRVKQQSPSQRYQTEQEIDVHRKIQFHVGTPTR